MTSRRAQRRDGTRKSRRPGPYWTRLSDGEFARRIAVWQEAGGPYSHNPFPMRMVPQPIRSETKEKS